MFLRKKNFKFFLRRNIECFYGEYPNGNFKDPKGPINGY